MLEKPVKPAELVAAVQEAIGTNERPSMGP
jgi:hypothetical protein